MVWKQKQYSLMATRTIHNFNNLTKKPYLNFVLKLILKNSYLNSLSYYIQVK